MTSNWSTHAQTKTKTRLEYAFTSSPLPASTHLRNLASGRLKENPRAETQAATVIEAYVNPVDATAETLSEDPEWF